MIRSISSISRIFRVFDRKLWTFSSANQNNYFQKFESDRARSSNSDHFRKNHHDRQHYYRTDQSRRDQSHRQNRSSSSNDNGIDISAIVFIPASVWSSFKYTFGLEKREDPSEEKIKDHIRRAMAACRESKFDDALAILHDALFESEQQRNENAINYSLDMLANIYYFIGRYEEAAQTFGALMQRLIAAGEKVDGETPTTSPAFVELSLKLADVYAMKGDDEKAVSGFDFCVATQKANVEREMADYKNQSVKTDGPMRHDFLDNPESTDPYALYGLVLETYARYLIRKGRVDESQSYINRSLEMALEIYGSTHPHTLAVMNNFAILCMGQNRHDIAERYLKEVVSRAPLSPGAAQYVIGYYTNYAESLWHLGRREEALDYARRAARLSTDKDVDEESKKRTQDYLRSLENDHKKESRKK